MARSRPGASSLAVGGPPHVDLMPRAVTERRDRNALIRRWGWGIVGALVVVILAVGGAFFLQAQATLRLATETADTNSLLGRIAALSDVGAKVKLDEELDEFRSVAMGTDLGWGAALESITSRLPEGVTVTDFSLGPGANPLGEDRALETGVAGEVTLASSTPTEIVALVRTLRSAPEVVRVDGWDSTSSEAGFSYLIKVELDQSFYTGQYVPEVTE